MHKNKNKFILFMSFSIVVLTTLIIIMIVMVNKIQGNARVVNHTGIVRGATQRLVKNEMHGVQDEKEIVRLDSIINSLQTPNNTYNLVLINDSEYQKKLQNLAQEWKTLKNAIYKARENSTSKDELYIISEKYFLIADDLVTTIQNYAEERAKVILVIEIHVIVCITAILLYLIIQIIREIKRNRKLNSIAFVDPHTGLPNKRCCEDILNDNTLIKAEHKVCCFMFDLNNLKITNDTYGHKCGDVLIKRFADILRHSTPEKMFVGRYGGDEFIGIIEETTLEEIHSIINRINSEVNMENSMMLHECQIKISFAYGFAFSTDYPNCTKKSLLDIADKEMYKCKAEMKGINIT